MLPVLAFCVMSSHCYVAEKPCSRLQRHSLLEGRGGMNKEISRAMGVRRSEAARSRSLEGGGLGGLQATKTFLRFP